MWLWISNEVEEKTNGPSYECALKFVTVYNNTIEGSEVVSQDLIIEKMNKITAYRERMKKKSTAFSRNIKKEDESMKKTSSKTESGICGSSTRESQDIDTHFS